MQRSNKDLVLPLTLEERYEQQVKQYPASEDKVKARLLPDVLESFSVTNQTKFVNVSLNANGLPTGKPVQQKIDYRIAAINCYKTYA